MNRRQFFGGALAVVGASIVPFRTGLGLMPTIYGDMINDDLAGLQALFDGKPVRMLTDAAVVQNADLVVLRGGGFLTTGTLVIRNRERPRIHIIESGITFRPALGQEKSCALCFE